MKCSICGMEYSTAGGNRHIGCRGRQEASHGKTSVVEVREDLPTAEKSGEKKNIGRVEENREKKFFKKEGAEGKK